MEQEKKQPEQRPVKISDEKLREIKQQDADKKKAVTDQTIIKK